MKIKKGDAVIVIKGKDTKDEQGNKKLKEGVVDRVYKKSQKVLIQGVNLYKRHLKKTDANKPGGIIEIPRAIPVANVMLKDPKTGEPTRVGFRIEGNKKVRYAKKSDTIIK